MCSKTIAEALADALPVGGTRGCTAHAAGACGATERTADGGGAATILSEEDRMNVVNRMNVDSSPTPILDIKTVISAEEYMQLVGQHSNPPIVQKGRVEDAPKLIEDGAVRLLADMTEPQRANRHSMTVGEKWPWTVGDDQDAAAIEAAATAICSGEKYRFANAKKLTSAWDSANLYGPNSKDRTLDAYREARNLLIAYLGYSNSPTEVDMLFELLDDRRINKRMTVLASEFTGNELRKHYLNIGAKAKRVDTLFSCLKKTVYSASG